MVIYSSDQEMPCIIADSIHTGTVSFDTLTEAFGPESLGIIIVKDLPQNFTQLRAQTLSHASYLAALPKSDLGKNQATALPPLPQCVLSL